jgi:hypothetical protein
VEADKPDRADSQFAANPMGMGTPLIFGAGLVKFPYMDSSRFASRKFF